MALETGNNEEREQRLQEILVHYVDALEQGHAPDPKEFLSRYPEFAPELEDYFAGCRQLDQFSAPLQGVVRPAVARQLGDFQLVREIGRGGMGIVYEAEQISLERRVALKVLPFAAMLDSKQLQRFKNEAHAAAHLHHSNIVPVYAVGHERGVHYFAMQFIDGQSLEAVLRELKHEREKSLELGGSSLEASRETNDTRKRGDNTPTTKTEGRSSSHIHPSSLIRADRDYFRLIARLGIQAAEALEHAHQQGIVHRDVKPANLLLDNQGHLWVTDFGLAHSQGDLGLTMTGDLVGTLRYMSPEQVLAKRGLVDHRADVYSLGATLYELLTLEPAVSGQDRQELLHRIAFEETILPSRRRKGIPADLETIVLKAMSKEVESRYGSAQSIAEDLQRFLADRPILARRPTLAHRTRKWIGRHKALTAAAVALLLLATIGLGVSTTLIWKKEEQTREALADSQRNQRIAEEQKLVAEGRERQARRYLYLADLNLAYQAWYAHQPARALRFLERQRPGPDQEDLRVFEWYHLQNECRQGQFLTLRGHSGSVTALALAPDRKELASAGEDGTAWLWDIATGQGSVFGRKIKAKVTSLSFIPDGKSVALMCDDGSLRLCDISNGDELATIGTGLRAPLAFSGDGSMLAVAGDGIELWSKELAVDNQSSTTGELRTSNFELRKLTPDSLSPRPYRRIALLKGTGYQLYSLALSRDGQTLAAGCNDGRVRIWQSPWQKEPSVIGRHHSYVVALCFSPDGRSLASGSTDGTVRLWDLANAKKEASIAKAGTPVKPESVAIDQTSSALNRHSGSVQGLAFSPDGKSVVSCGEEGSVQLWNLGTEEMICRGVPEEINAMALSTDGQLLVTGQGEGSIKLWRVADMQTPVLRHGQAVNCLALGRDNRTLVSAGGQFPNTSSRPEQWEGRINLWDAVSGNRLAGWAASKAKLQAICLSPDSTTLASAGDDGSIRLWDVATRRSIGALPGHVGPVWCAAFSPDGKMLATAGYGDRLIKLWRLATKQCLAILQGHTDSLWSVAFSPDGRLLASGGRDSTAMIWNLPEEAGVTQSKPLAAAPENPILQRPVTVLRGHKNWVWGVQFSPDGQTLATGSGDRTIKLWDTATWQLRSTLQGHSTFVRSLIFFPNGKTLATGSDDHTVKLWDLETGLERATLRGHQQAVTCLAVSSDGRLLISGSWDGTVRLWPAPKEESGVGRREQGKGSGVRGQESEVARNGPGAGEDSFIVDTLIP
jgi:WD40 repeat protein/serine/threonine protein kinase